MWWQRTRPRGAVLGHHAGLQGEALRNHEQHAGPAGLSNGRPRPGQDEAGDVQGRAERRRGGGAERRRVEGDGGRRRSGDERGQLRAGACREVMADRPAGGAWRGRRVGGCAPAHRAARRPRQGRPRAPGGLPRTHRAPCMAEYTKSDSFCLQPDPTHFPPPTSRHDPHPPRRGNHHHVSLSKEVTST